MNQLKTNLETLRNELSDFIDFFAQDYDYTTMVYELWDAKDILGHITYWHESFAKNLLDLANERIPNPPKGKLSDVNVLSVESTREVPKETLIQRLKKAQHTIELHIFDEKIKMIPYKKGSRDYSRIEHLEIVADHIHKHLTDLKKAVNTM